MTRSDARDPITEYRRAQQYGRDTRRRSPMGNTAVSDGRFRIVSSEGFIVEGEASALVRGLLEVIGRLAVSGEIDLTGILNQTAGQVNLGSDVNVTGDFTQTAGKVSLESDVEISGDLKISGDTEIDGDTQLKGDMTVATGGGITIDSDNPLKLSPDGSHAIEWESGAYLQSNDGGVGIGASGHSAALQANADGTGTLFYPSESPALLTDGSNAVFLLSPDGNVYVSVQNAGVVMANLPTAAAAGRTPNLYVNASGQIFRLI